MAPAHSPSIAHACVQSSGVLALHPSKGVRTSPPLIASAGSSGTAVVARKLARLLWSAVTHSSADLRLAVTIASSAGGTAEVAIVAQPSTGFLNGSFYPDGSPTEDTEDCLGRITVGLTRSKSLTLLASPLDMMGLMGMAQAIAAIVVKPLRPLANLVGGCCLGSGPFSVSGLLFFALTRRKSAGGFAGRLFVFVCDCLLVRCDLPALLGLLSPCTNSFSTAYAHVRTEPQCDIRNPRKKKSAPSNPAANWITSAERH